MKKLQLLLATLVCSLVFASAASADLGYPVNLWAYDVPTTSTNFKPNEFIDLRINHLINEEDKSYVLEYSIGNTNNFIAAGTTIHLAGSALQFFFRLVDEDTNEIIRNANLVFANSDGAFFKNAYINWDGTETYEIVAGLTGDRVSNVAPVPVPPAAYLLASGVIGIITMRRKKAADQA